MESLDDVKKYSQTVCEQIRWKKARPLVAREIEDHIYDQRDALISNGYSEETATKNAVAQMGDAVLVGFELDKTHKPRPQWIMILLTAALMFIGILSNYYIAASKFSRDSFHFLPFMVPLLIFVFCYYVDFTIWGKYAIPCYYVIVILSVIGLLYNSELADQHWFHRGVMPFNLSYLSLIYPLVYALFVYAMHNKGYRGILFCLLSYLPLAAILLSVHTLSGYQLFSVTACILICISILKGWMGEIKKKVFFLSFFILFFATQITYISNYLFINDDTYYYTDTTFLKTIQNRGFYVAIGVIAILIAFFAAGIYKTAKQKSMLGTLVSLSILSTFILQIILYIIDYLGYAKSFSFPLISYGKTAFTINAALIGFMLSVFRTGENFNDNFKIFSNNQSLFSFKDGTFSIHFKRC